MSYSIEALPKVNHLKRKLNPKLQRVINTEVDKILFEPYAGERKTGDLKGVFVHKFRYQELLFLIAYTIDEKAKVITIFAIGPHENFYRDLKRYLTSIRFFH